jgi:hypothetical protein
MKYIGALHSYIRHTLLFFNPTNLDEVCVQATHLESMGKNGREENPFKHSKNHFNGKGNGRTRGQLQQIRKKENHLATIARKLVMIANIVGNYIQS